MAKGEAIGERYHNEIEQYTESDSDYDTTSDEGNYTDNEESMEDMSESDSIPTSDFSAVNARASQINFRSSISNAQGMSKKSAAIAKQWRLLHKRRLPIPTHHLEHLILEHSSSTLNDTLIVGDASATGTMHNVTNLSMLNQDKLLEETIDYEFKINVAVNKIKALRFSVPFCLFISRVINIPVPTQMVSPFSPFFAIIVDLSSTGFHGTYVGLALKVQESTIELPFAALLVSYTLS